MGRMARAGRGQLRATFSTGSARGLFTTPCAHSPLGFGFACGAQQISKSPVREGRVTRVPIPEKVGGVHFGTRVTRPSGNCAYKQTLDFSPPILESQLMFARFDHVLLTITLLTATGAHWTVLQSIA